MNIMQNCFDPKKSRTPSLTDRDIPCCFAIRWTLVSGHSTRRVGAKQKAMNTKSSWRRKVAVPVRGNVVGAPVRGNVVGAPVRGNVVGAPPAPSARQSPHGCSPFLQLFALSNEVLNVQIYYSAGYIMRDVKMSSFFDRIFFKN